MRHFCLDMGHAAKRLKLRQGWHGECSYGGMHIFIATARSPWKAWQANISGEKAREVYDGWNTTAEGELGSSFEEYCARIGVQLEPLPYPIEELDEFAPNLTVIED